MFSCVICNKTFKSRQAVNGHYFIHGGKENQNYEKNYRPRCSCIYTKRKVYADKLDEYIASLNQCKHCGKIVKKANKFCNSSCAAAFNNRARTAAGWKPSIEHRMKTRSTLRKFYNSDAKVNVHPISKKRDTVRKYAKSVVAKFTRVRQCTYCSTWFKDTGRKTCSTTCCRAVFSRTAKNNKMMGGNKNTRAHGWYESPSAGSVWLESSYEYRVAVDLDSNNVSWSRPKYLKYGNKKYFADFYLVDYDVYLDPKNDYLITLDQEKIKQVCDENNVVVHILNKHQLSWEYISGLIS